MLLQLAEGLAYIHSRKLVHRDIKPENVLIHSCDSSVSSVTMKWSDFGLSRPVNERGTFPMVNGVQGTEKWLAPELLKLLRQGDLSSRDQSIRQIHGTTKSDVFAQGLLFGYFLSNGQHPYGADFLEIPLNIMERRPINMISNYPSRSTNVKKDSQFPDFCDRNTIIGCSRFGRKNAGKRTRGQDDVTERRQTTLGHHPKIQKEKPNNHHIIRRKNSKKKQRKHQSYYRQITALKGK